MNGDFQETIRHGDLPRYKESIMSQLFGEVIGWLRGKGLKDDQEFATANKPILQCSKKVIWIDQVSPQKQIVWSFNSIRMEVEYGVADKTTAPREVLHREKIENLRYQISTGSEPALTKGSRAKFDAMFANFTRQFALLNAALIITLLLCASAVSHAQTAGGLGNPPTTSGSGVVFSTGTLTIASSPAITIRSDGKIICHACKDVPPDAVIGTLTDAARNEMFPAITVPPKSPFSAITIGSDNLTRYNHAQQTIKRDDFTKSQPVSIIKRDAWKPWGAMTIASTATCAAGVSADVISSNGLNEQNPLLRNSQGGVNRGAGAIFGAATCGVSFLFERHHPKMASIIRFSLGGIHFGAAIHNWKVNR